MNIDLILIVATIGIIAFVVGDAIYQYRATPGTEIMTAFRNSATLLWSRLVAASSALIALAVASADYLGQPAIAEATKSLIKPEYVPIFGLVVAVVTELARRRTL